MPSEITMSHHTAPTSKAGGPAQPRLRDSRLAAQLQDEVNRLVAHVADLEMQCKVHAMGDPGMHAWPGCISRRCLAGA